MRLNPFALAASFFPAYTQNRPQVTQNALSFELRHYHGVAADTSRVVFADAPQSLLPVTYEVKTRPVITKRPPSFTSPYGARIKSQNLAQDLSFPWDEEEVIGPDVESREAILTLAKMTNDAYLDNCNSTQWYDLGDNWTDSYPFGWEPDADGFRGHVFATADNSTIVISVKGTSAGIFGSGGPTVTKDKKNDNLLFSCCCAHIDWTWSTVCNCHAGGWQCNQDCVEDALTEDSLYYPIGTNLYNNLTYMYPTSNIWLIGHSLGGGLASLLGATFGIPTVAFESPGEKLAASRLHLPSMPEVQHITHVYHTADPVAMGTCTGIFSACSLAGYALETRCHLGKSIVFDTVTELGWSAGITHHGIINVIDEVLSKPWKPSEAEGREVPVATSEEDCVECYSWDYGNYPPKG